MIFKMFFVLYVIGVREVACCCFECPLVTEDMAKTCITTDPECAAVPLMDDNCFNGCTIICSKLKVDERNSTTVKPAMK
uniref:Uncharacterized protein n=1 Tax=Magallana gigas TaxID=29159 RepID=A0A8W8P7G5_MAGGI